MLAPDAVAKDEVDKKVDYEESETTWYFGKP